MESMEQMIEKNNEIAQIKNTAKQKRFILKRKVVLLFFSMMFFFTISSRIANSFTVPRVKTKLPETRKIRHSIKAEGIVRERKEIAVYTVEGICVASVEVSKGQTVEAGDVLFIVEEEDLQEQLIQAREDREMLDWQNKALAEREKAVWEKREVAVSRVKEDISFANLSMGKKLAQAQAEWIEAQRALEAWVKTATATESVTLESTTQKKDGEAYEENHTDFSRKNAKAAEKDEIVQYKRGVGIEQNDQYQEESVKENAEEEKAEWEAEYEKLAAAVLEKEQIYEELLEKQQAEQTAYRRALEDAQEREIPDYQMQMNEITQNRLQRKLEKLEALKEAEGKIYAPKSGTITQILAQEGMKTIDTAMVLMADDDAGYCFTAAIPVEKESDVSVGAEVLLTSPTKKKQNLQVDFLEKDEKGSFLEAMVLLPKEEFSIGETLSMEISKTSEEYPYTLPEASLHRENNQYFVYIVETEKTILGEAQVARKIEVDVLEKNDTYVAVDGSGISESSQIIIEADRYLETGERVRQW